MPSYFLRDSDKPEFAKAYLAEKEFQKNGQINWEDLYAANQNNIVNNGNSIYAVYEDRNDDKQFSINSVLYKKRKENY